MQRETQMILDNIGEAVITHTDQGIKFFNKAGRKILRKCISSLEEDIRQSCYDEIKSIETQFEKGI